MTLRFSRRASNDLKRIYQFISDVAPQALDRASARLAWAFDSLERFPDMGMPRDSTGKSRSLVVIFGKGSFIIHYSTSHEFIYVLQIWHSKEKKDQFIKKNSVK